MKSEHLYFELFQQNLSKFKQIRGDEWIGCCLWHDDKTPSLSVNVREGLYHCFACGESGNAVKLAKHIGIDPKPFYSDEHKKNYKVLDRAKHDQKPTANGKIVPDLDKLTNIAVEYYKNAGEEIKGSNTMTMLEVGRDKTGRLTFPYYNDSGQVIGIKHHKHPDYKNKKKGVALCFWEGNGDAKWYLAELLNDYDKNEPLFICEGEKDAIVLLRNGFNVICSSSPTTVPTLLPVFKKFKKIYLIYDNDPAGEKQSEKCARELYQSLGIRSWVCQWRADLPLKFDVSDDTEWIEVPRAITNAVQYELALPKKIGVFNIMTGQEAISTNPIPQEWLIKGVIPKKFNSCIAGTTGSKKSYWAMQLGMSLANGEKSFCGNKIHTDAIRVLYCDTEIGKEETHRRFRNLANKMNWTEQGSANFPMMSKDGSSVEIWDDVHEFIKYWKPELIIFDSLYNTTSVGDFSKSRQMSSVINELTRFKEMYDVTILCVAHFNKNQGDMGLDINRMSGSSVLQNWVEWQMLMITTNQENFNLWKVGKTRGTHHDTTTIGLEWNDFWFTAKGVVPDVTPFLLDNQKKNKWQMILDDLPDEFDSQRWLNVFKNYHNYSDRTGRAWLSDCCRTPMLDNPSHNYYVKKLKVIDEDNFDDE